MSKLTELIQFADQLGQRKIAERRYQDQRNMQLAQIAEAKDKENKIIGSQHLLNNALMKFNESGWEDGVYKGSDVSSDDVLQEYLTSMTDKYGLAGNAIAVSEALDTQKSKQVMKDAAQLNLKVKAWDEQNKNKYDNLNPFDNYKLAEDRKAYLKSINAEALYGKIYGTFGEAKALEGTGLTPSDFGKSASSFQQDSPKLAGAGTLAAAGGGLFIGKQLLNAAKGSIERGLDLDIAKGKGQALVGSLERRLTELEAATPTAEVKKNISLMKKQLEVIKQRGHIDRSSWTVLDNLNKKIPEGAVDNVDDILKNKKSLKAAKDALNELGDPSTTSKVLRYLKKVPKLGLTLGTGVAAYEIAKKLTSGFTDTALGEEDSTAGKVAGVAGGSVGAAFSGAAVRQAFKTIGDNISKKGTRWAITKVMKRGGPALAAKFVLKAGLGGLTSPFSAGASLVGTSIWLASDAYEVARILSEEE
jgi:hypothetical protein